MELDTILVVVLIAGVAGLLVWFEINSRRNEASKKQMSPLAQSALGPLQKKAESQVEVEIDKTNAA
jgi:hypothetical protein